MSTDEAVLEAAVPVLQVTDLSQALEYYRDVLGFELAWTWGDPPDRASVCRDNAEVTLSVQQDRPPSLSRVYFATKNVNSYYKRVSASGGTVTVPIADRPYGMTDFSVLDPSGNSLSFGEPTES